MNGHSRLDFAARRKGWKIEQRRKPGRGIWAKEFTCDDFIIEVWFSGYTVHSALMCDASGVMQGLGPDDRDKAERIESVLLMNSRTL